MNIGLSEISHSFRSLCGSSGMPIRYGHAQQLLAAALGYKALASYQAAQRIDQEPQSFDQTQHVVLDSLSMAQRAVELGIEINSDQLWGLLTKAFEKRTSSAVVHGSHSDLDDHIRMRITQLVENDGHVNGEMAQLNHDGLDEVFFDLEVDLSQIQVGQPFADIITGHVNLNRDTERPYTGTKIDFELTVSIERLGKHCYGGIDCEITNVLARAPWDYDNNEHDASMARTWTQDDDEDGEDGEQQARTRADLIAELLGWSVDEVGDLEDVDEMPLDGNSGEMIYGYLLDFTDHASSGVAARIMREHGTLQFRVGPSFFEGSRYEGWPH